VETLLGFSVEVTQVEDQCVTFWVHKPVVQVSDVLTAEFAQARKVVGVFVRVAASGVAVGGQLVTQLPGCGCLHLSGKPTCAASCQRRR
jgi:hypothetical protein